VIARIGFVGLGRMGKPMARLLGAAGNSAVAFDSAPDGQARAAEIGVRWASSPSDVARGADVVFLSLPTPSAVRDVLCAKGGVLETAEPGAVIVDLSTSSPVTAREVADAGAGIGVHVLDAPVSGGPVRAQDGTLTIMVGGNDGAFRIVKPYLDILGSSVIHMGGPGTGQATKLCNNLLAGIAMAGIAEAVALAHAEHLDPHRLFEVLSSSSGDSSVLRRRFPVEGVVPTAPVNRGFEAEFSIELIQKDLDLALAIAQRHDIDIPITASALGQYRLAVSRGLAHLDYSAVSRLLS
jgi:3-hydroxyisobutyrate dehydrogenase